MKTTRSYAQLFRRNSVSRVKILVCLLLQFSVSFYRASAYWRDIDIANLSVCLSVCPSVRYVPVTYENGLTYRHSFFSPYGSPIILVIPASNVFTKFRRGHPLRGAKYSWGRKISRFSTNKSLYLANNTKYCHSYHGRQIGTRTRSIKWCHFQWPWTNPNPVFKVTPSLTLNISQTATDTAIVTIEDE